MIRARAIPFPALALSLSLSGAAFSAAPAAPAAPFTPPPGAADINRDGSIDAADVEAFLQAVKDGKTLDAALDLDDDKAVDLEDALLFGRWVNGLWTGPASGFAPLHFKGPADEAAFRRYPQALKDNASLTFDALLARYPSEPGAPPAYPEDKLEFAGEVTAAIRTLAPRLNPAGLMNQVRRDGMAVAESLYFPNPFQALDAIHHHDLPLLFTTDALLHTVYRSYDNILIEIEEQVLIPSLVRILRASLDYLRAHHGAGDAALDAREVVETALLLLGEFPSGQQPLAASQARLGEIAALEARRTRLFGQDTLVDYSQFKPRGHYDRTKALERYFKAMMWLGRADLAFDLRANDPARPRAALTRMKKGAVILWDAVMGSGSYPAWLRMNTLLEYLVGKADGLTVKGMGTLAHALSVRDAGKYLETFDEAKFDEALRASGLGMQGILSQAKTYAGFTKDLDLSPIFSFMPQRFILDSYTFSQTVFPATDQIMPRSLDIAFVLGDNSALRDRAGSSPSIPPVLAAQRGLYDALSPPAWRSDMYASWLGFLRALNAEDDRDFAPAFRTLAWKRKMRNTLLASWAQLRHNTILYAKQSYTGGVICDFPRAYVEPYPRFFEAVGDYAALGGELFRDRPEMASYFAGLASISRRLAGIARGAAQGGQPSDEEVAWLRTALSSRLVPAGCTSVRVYDGWYRSLIYGSLGEAADGRDYTIADVHTKPMDDELGPAQVLHVATGPIQLMVTAIKLDTCVSLFVGPVSSFYEVTRVGSPLIRMTNSEWTQALDKREPFAVRPPWARAFLAP
jgi:hypothetical protein